MRVLINAASAHMGGAVTYLHNVLKWLPRVAPEDYFLAFTPAATRARLAPLAEAPSVQVEAYPYARTTGPARVYFDQVTLPQIARAQGIDLVFSSTGFGTVFCPCPQVLLVRNLAYFDRQFHDTYRRLGRSLRKNTLRRWMSLLSIRQADVVLFPSQAMATEVDRYTSLANKPAEAVHYGFDREAFVGAGAGAPACVEDVQRWKAEGYRILLNVSTFAVQKNLETLIEALPLVAAAGHSVKVLTTTSREKTTDKAEYDALVRRAAARGVADAWIETGYVPYGQLHALYQAADLYVFPSFSESFGHSLVEAMASGLPVIAADTPTNREVCGGHGRFFPAFDPAACARTLVHVLEDADERARLAQASLARAPHFSWHSYAEALMDLFRRAHHASSPSVAAIGS